MVASKETQARIKINKLLVAASWRFFDDARGKANVVLVANSRLVRTLMLSAKIIR